MLTRRCARCEEEKTIRGVWYMVRPPVFGVPAEHADFVCETCMSRAPVLAAAA